MLRADSLQLHTRLQYPSSRDLSCSICIATLGFETTWAVSQVSIRLYAAIWQQTHHLLQNLLQAAEADVEREAEVKRKGEAEVQADVENSEVRKVYPNSKNSTVQF